MTRSNNFPPGPSGHWLQGNLPEYRRGRLQFLERIRAEYGTIASYRLGSIPVVLVCEPQHLREILVTNNKSYGRSISTRMLSEFFGNGLLISEGERWLRDRRIIQPTFAKEHIEQFADCMVRRTSDCIELWNQGDRRDALLDMQSLTMSIAAETLLGVKLHEEVAAIHDPHEIIRGHFDYRMEHLWVTPRWIPTRHNRKVNAAYHAIRKIVDDLIAKRKNEHQSGTDILSRLIQIQRSQAHAMTDQQLRDQVLTFLFAGHETTASLLGWVWWLLGKFPDVANRLHDEIDDTLQGKRPTIADVPKLRYTDKVIRETLRLFPSAYVMGRQALEDTHLGEYDIPRGTNLVISPWLMQRDSRFWDHPLDFDPDRWTDSTQKTMDQFAWFPFGAGPRICIGKAFAMLESVLIVATIASRFNLVLPSNQAIEPHASVTIRPSPGVQVICHERTSFRKEFSPARLETTL
ncbi:cytochrome P450 [Bremerella sp. P1]|uniref:cytochrome P450 n=1 Tax=Bremerella sp. P1 TaxID=3026424 RepID=UPI002368256C|nr:cytochrome P450 [Bremerella sp. P1]WDI40558.1 cytochrome P450 [Bremerella sp. P1]